MRVCPKCGYVDPLQWKNLPMRLYGEYMTFEEFKELYPTIAEQLRQNPKIVFNEYNAYHLSKAGYVHRCPKILCQNGRFYHESSTKEKPKDPFQRKLDIFAGVDQIET